MGKIKNILPPDIDTNDIKDHIEYDLEDPEFSALLYDLDYQRQSLLGPDECIIMQSRLTSCIKHLEDLLHRVKYYDEKLNEKEFLANLVKELYDIESSSLKSIS